MFELSVLVPASKEALSLLGFMLELDRRTHCPFEVVLVDTISDDMPREDDYMSEVVSLAGSALGNRLRTIRPGSGLTQGEVMNAALATARGECVAWMNTQCRPVDGTLDHAVDQVFRGHGKSIVALFQDYSDLPAIAYQRKMVERDMIVGQVNGTVIAEAGVALASSLKALGGWDNFIDGFASTIDLSLRVMDAGHRIDPAVSGGLIWKHIPAAPSDLGLSQLASKWQWSRPGTTDFDASAPSTARRLSPAKVAA
jgi:hypothetical protein